MLASLLVFTCSTRGSGAGLLAERKTRGKKAKRSRTHSCPHTSCVNSEPSAGRAARPWAPPPCSSLRAAGRGGGVANGREHGGLSISAVLGAAGFPSQIHLLVSQAKFTPATRPRPVAPSPIEFTCSTREACKYNGGGAPRVQRERQHETPTTKPHHDFEAGSSPTHAHPASGSRQQQQAAGRRQQAAGRRQQHPRAGPRSTSGAGKGSKAKDNPVADRVGC